MQGEGHDPHLNREEVPEDRDVDPDVYDRFTWHEGDLQMVEPDGTLVPLTAEYVEKLRQRKRTILASETSRDAAGNQVEEILFYYEDDDLTLIRQMTVHDGDGNVIEQETWVDGFDRRFCDPDPNG